MLSGMFDLIPWSEIKSMPPAMEVYSINHWTTRKALGYYFRLGGQRRLLEGGDIGVSPDDQFQANWNLESKFQDP